MLCNIYFKYKSMVSMKGFVCYPGRVRSAGVLMGGMSV